MTRELTGWVRQRVSPALEVAVDDLANTRKEKKSAIVRQALVIGLDVLRNEQKSKTPA